MYPDSKYISLGYLQSYFVNKDTGKPLSGGKVTFYSDAQRSTLKPAYQLNGSPGTYNFVELSNPMVLSANGTFINETGDDVVPYALPYNNNGSLELYYIKVTDSAGIEQFTRQGVPSDISETQQEIGNTFSNNYIKNGQFAVINSDIATNFLYNSGKKFIDNSLFTNSPYDTGLVFYINGTSEHTNIGDCFILQNPSSIDQSLSVGVLDNEENPIGGLSIQEANPYYYLKYSSANTSGEYFKYILDIAGDISAYAGKKITYSVVCNTASAGVTLGACCIQIYYDSVGAYIDNALHRTNTGVVLTSSINYVEIKTGTNKISFDILVPALDSALLTAGGGVFIVGLALPTNVICNINITNKQLNDYNIVVPSYPYSTLSNVQSEMYRLPVLMPNALATQYHALEDLKYKNPNNMGYKGHGFFAKTEASNAINSSSVVWGKPLIPGSLVPMLGESEEGKNRLDWLYSNGSRYLSYSYGDLFKTVSLNNIPTYGTGSTLQSSGLTGNIFTVTSNEFGVGRSRNASSEFTLVTNDPGSSSTALSFNIVCPAASEINPIGSYIRVKTTVGPDSYFNIYFIIDGFVDPSLYPLMRNDLQSTFVYLASYWASDWVAKVLYKVFDPLTFVIPNLTFESRYYLVKT